MTPEKALNNINEWFGIEDCESLQEEWQTLKSAVLAQLSHNTGSLKLPTWEDNLESFKLFRPHKWEGNPNAPCVPFIDSGIIDVPCYLAGSQNYHEFIERQLHEGA